MSVDDNHERDEAAADVRALFDFKADRVIEHEEVTRWLRSWDSDKPLPRPRPKQHTGWTPN